MIKLVYMTINIFGIYIICIFMNFLCVTECYMAFYYHIYLAMTGFPPSRLVQLYEILL